MRLRFALALLLGAVLTGCGGLLAPPSSAGTAGCELAPLAQEISAQTRAAMVAARAGDKEAMVAASKAILERVERIIGAMEAGEPQASLDPVLSSLLSVAYAGNQAGIIFADAVPTAEEVDSFESTILGALDLSVEQVDSVAAGC